MSIVSLRRWCALSAAGVIAIVLLAQLSMLEERLHVRRDAAAVFNTAREDVLRDDSLVSEMSALSEEMRLLRVRWDHGILAVDLAAAAPSDLWLNAASIMGFAFKDKSNVGQLLLRFYHVNDQERTLLSSIETRRADWTEQALSRLRPTDLTPNAANERIRLTLTPAGERWLRNFSNS